MVSVSATVGGAVVLFLVGLAFLGAAVWSWTRRPDEPDLQRSLGIAVDVLVGVVALVDAAISVVDEPGRPALWMAGSVVLVVALVLLHRRRRTPRLPTRIHHLVGQAR